MDTLDWRLWMMVAVIAVVTFVLTFFVSLAEASGCRTVTIQQGIRIVQCVICTNSEGEVISIQCF